MKQNQTDKYVWGKSCYADTCGTAPAADLLSSCTTDWGQPGKCGVSGPNGDIISCRECSVDADCGGGGKVCDAIKCVPSTCKNLMLDAGETDIDCGGTCVPCAVGMKCTLLLDCQGNGLCSGNPKTCQAPACDDLTLNGDETDLDCGGSCALDPGAPKTCKTGLNCLLPADCTSGRCQSGQCK